MNIVLLRPQDWIDESRVRLTDRRHRHIADVLKPAPGDTLRVGLLAGNRGQATVESLDGSAVVLTVTLDTPPPPRHGYSLVVALPRPKMLRRVLRTCAEFGVGEVHLIHSWRVEKSFWQSPLLSQDNIDNALQAGLERSGDTQPPRVSLHRRFRPFVEDTLPVIARGGAIYVAHPGDYPLLGRDNDQCHGDASSCSTGAAVVMIGPEGGFIPFEVEVAIAQGAEPRSLGSRILSVDTAVNAVLARGLDPEATV